VELSSYSILEEYLEEEQSIVSHRNVYFEIKLSDVDLNFANHNGKKLAKRIDLKKKSPDGHKYFYAIEFKSNEESDAFRTALLALKEIYMPDEKVQSPQMQHDGIRVYESEINNGEHDPIEEVVTKKGIFY
jgi:hypothetical protein